MHAHAFSVVPRTIFLILCIVAPILALGTWTYTRAVGSQITACADKTGLVFVVGDGFARTKCLRGQQLLTWNIQGLQGPKGDKGDAGASGLSPHLYDANNQDLGIFLGRTSFSSGDYETLASGITVYFTTDDNNQTAVLHASQETVAFTTTDCSGTPYVVSPRPTNTLTSYLQTPIGIRYYTRLPLPSAPQLLQANIDPTTSSACQVFPDHPATVNVTPMREITLPFTLPLNWPLTIK